MSILRSSLAAVALVVGLAASQVTLAGPAGPAARAFDALNAANEVQPVQYYGGRGYRDDDYEERPRYRQRRSYDDDYDNPPVRGPRGGEACDRASTGAVVCRAYPGGPVTRVCNYGSSGALVCRRG